MRTTVLALPRLASALPTALGLAFLLVVTAAALACTRGSGTPSQEARSTAAFDAIDVGGPFQVNVQVGPEHRVELRGDDNVVPTVRSEVVGSTLHIDLPERVVTKLPLEAIITTPALLGLDASGATTVTITELTGTRFETEVSGASRVSLTGTVETLDADVSGASTLDAAALTTAQAKVEVSGASKATVRATHELQAEASGASTIRYHGKPAQVHQHQSGASTIEAAP